MRRLLRRTAILVLLATPLAGQPSLGTTLPGDVAARPAVPFIVAHRGASKDAPENTLPAFRLAWEQGADAIEGDFHLTADNRIVCIHDKDTNRVADEVLTVAKSTLAELRRLDVGKWHSPTFAGTCIPTLTEILPTVPRGKRIYIEIKCGPEIVPALLEQIDRSKLQSDQIVVIAFNPAVVRTLKERSPRTRAYWLVSFKVDATGTAKPTLDTTLKTIRTTRADGLGSNTAIPETYPPALRRAGHEWHVWTIDDPMDARRFLEMGARSITTNVPRLIGRELAPRPVPR